MPKRINQGLIPTLPNSHTKYYVWGLDLSGSLQGAGGIGDLLSVHTFAPLAVHFPTTDANGNISEYLTTNGSVAAHYEYDAFGRTIAQFGPLAATFAHRILSTDVDWLRQKKTAQGLPTSLP